jgi:hypothetical protein
MLRKALLGLSLLSALGAASADTLLLDGIEVATQSAQARPARGATMANVEARFGTPLERVAAVGDPPIARWEYADFTVFFEHDRVIHCVVRH